MPNSQGRTGFGGGLLIGFSVGLLWTPCVGPILASVISLAITGTVTFDAFLITLAYSLGTAIPMFLIILGGQNALRRVPWLLANTGKIQKAFGILMIITAIGIYFNVDRRFQTYILNTFPQYGAGLTQFEDNEMIRKQLDKKSGGKIKKEDMNKLQAPELIPGGVWFNSDPLTLSQLKGKVVIIDFWTYTCINCQRTFPYLKQWHEKYKDQGLVIIGVHSPEFEFEKVKRILPGQLPILSFLIQLFRIIILLPGELITTVTGQPNTLLIKKDIFAIPILVKEPTMKPKRKFKNYWE